MENSKIKHNLEKVFSNLNLTGLIGSVGLIHTHTHEATPETPKTADNRAKYKSKAVFRPMDTNESPYTYRITWLDKGTFLQRSDRLPDVPATLSEHKEQLIAHSRKKFLEDNWKILKIEFFDNTGLGFNKVGETRRRFTHDGVFIGWDVIRKKNSDGTLCDFWAADPKSQLHRKVKFIPVENKNTIVGSGLK